MASASFPIVLVWFPYLLNNHEEFPERHAVVTFLYRVNGFPLGHDWRPYGWRINLFAQPIFLPLFLNKYLVVSLGAACR